MEIEESDERSKRFNVRIPTKQYKRMMTYGEILGLETESAVIRHFLTLGLQFGGASIAAQISAEVSGQALLEVQGLRQDANALQTDLIEAASKGSSN